MRAQQRFLVAGIGASAGGIEAIEGFFKRVPADAGVAFVIVTHLSPDRESVLHDIVAGYTPLRTAVIADGMAIELNTVYVMPSNAALSVSNGHFRLRSAGGQREQRPIDDFFSALAVDMGERAVGVVLSGGNADGTLGLKTIKERGGATFAQVQDGFGPRHPDMPDAAILSGLVDFALPADDLGVKIVEPARDFPGGPVAPGSAAAAASTEQAIALALPSIYEALRAQVGRDFSGYKTRTFVRRVQRRMHLLQLAGIDAYLTRLDEDMQEVAALFRDLLINVTNFFRDGDAFDALAAHVIPRLFEGRDASETVRIWIPGCATGEEVYSMSILVHEHLDTLEIAPSVQIFATDIDERALAVARVGRYPGPLLESVSPERRRRFFVPDAEAFVVAKEVRELCIFSPHSVIRDPPFSRIDLVSCRNLLIYLGAEVQSQVIPTFHYALRPGGFLFLGTAENVSQFGDLFSPIEKRTTHFPAPAQRGRQPADASSAARLARRQQRLDRAAPYDAQRAGVEAHGGPASARSLCPGPRGCQSRRRRRVFLQPHWEIPRGSGRPADPAAADHGAPRAALGPAHAPERMPGEWSRGHAGGLGCGYRRPARSRWSWPSSRCRRARRASRCSWCRSSTRARSSPWTVCRNAAPPLMVRRWRPSASFTTPAIACNR
jgi:two-component system CheB/CheR fusion protein